MHEDDQGPGHLPRAVRGRRGAVQHARRHRRLGGGPRLCRRADADAGTRACSISRRPPRARPIATRSPARWPAHGLEITELSTHLQGQLVAVHPAYDACSTASRRPRCAASRQRARPGRSSRCTVAAQASRNLGLKAHATFSGALAWPYLYPWPQRPAGLIEEAFAELARRWKPILDAFEEAGVDVCFEIHPGEDLHDGATFERFLERVGDHPRANILYDPSHFVLQQLDYLDFIDIYHERIKIFHVKDAEFNPTGKQGVYGGYQGWVDRPGRFRSLGDGQVDFGAIFSKLAAVRLSGLGGAGMGVRLKHPEDGAREGAPFIARHIIRVTDHAFDDFAGRRR